MASKIRYHFLDELRGFAIFCMVFYHAFYTIAFNFDISFGGKLLHFFEPAEPFFAAFFIFLSGIACQFSHSNLIRGLKLLAISLAITAITLILPRYGIKDCEIYFGILHLLSLGMLLLALINPLVKKLPPLIFIILFLALFMATYNISLGYLGFGAYTYNLPKTLYKNDYLFAIGFYSNKFYSADYFPLLPWIFMFLAGAHTGVYAVKDKFPKFMIKKRIPFFAFLGRHSLLIYILHQPIIYGLCYLVEYIIGLY